MLEIYADESSISNNRYAVIGGVVINSKSKQFINDRLEAIRGGFRLNKEIKWTRTHASHFIAYRGFINEFFDLNLGGRLHFHTVIIDSHQVRGDRNLGHSKFVYQLLLKFGRLYGHSDGMDVHLDAGKTHTPLEELRTILNRGISKRQNIHTSPYKSLQTLDSKQSLILQANDLIIGAISHAKNERHLAPDGRPEKHRLAEYVRAKTNLRSICNDATIGNRFSIWNFALQKHTNAAPRS